MIDSRTAEQFLKAVRPTSQVPFSTEVIVPKDHPGLPRLAESLKKLPCVVLETETGVSVKKKQLLRSGAYDEFFDALGDVIGHQNADDILEHLLACVPSREHALQSAARLAMQSIPMLQAMSGLGRR